MKNPENGQVLNSVLAEKADTGEWRRLFNGKDLTGWKQAGPGSHYVEDGLIKWHGGMGLLYWIVDKFGNRGSRSVILLNGVKVTDYKEGDEAPKRSFDYEPIRAPRPEYGYIGLQNHDDENIVFFK